MVFWFIFGCYEKILYFNVRDTILFNEESQYTMFCKIMLVIQWIQYLFQLGSTKIFPWKVDILVSSVLSKSVFIVEEEATDLSARIIKNNESPLKLYIRSGHANKQGEESWTTQISFFINNIWEYESKSKLYHWWLNGNS